ncbi:KUP/HAK/KT family potassium transporter [Paraburkholderia bryophila]|uniref:KUP/HAK/KT family potassium transporter n=1 Tax=Paraburkholderia bryophila TaxID=420952 RepID=UPI003AF12D32
MTTWHKGREAVVERMKSDHTPLAPLIHSLCDGAHSPSRVNGAAVFPGGVVDMAPTAFLHNLKHNEVMHQYNIFLAGTTDNVPHVPDEKTAVVVDLGHGCYAITVHHGFMEIPNVPAILELAQKQMPDWRYEPADTSFFLARDTIMATGASKAMPLWREKLFAFLARNAAQAAEYYSLPANRVVEMGSQINL